MKEFTIGPNDSGQRLDRFLSKTVPLLPASLAQKYIRIKRIKLNGGRAERDTRLAVGDKITVFGEVAGEISSGNISKRPAIYARFIDLQ